MWNLDSKPIIACCTGRSENSAISVIRLSGFSDLEEYLPFFSLKSNEIKARQSYFCRLIDKESVLDEIVLTYFKAPFSYTGENTLELSVHGNQINVTKIINFFTSTGLCREAKAGEFSYRALKNKKLSLTQIEGLEVLLNAKSSLALDSGVQSLMGELNQSYKNLHSLYIEIKSCIELLIDFSEDVGEEETWAKLKLKSDQFCKLVNLLYKRCLPDKTSLLTPAMALFGKTNAGKSSFFNYLVGHDRSIVSEIEGTTRDYVSEVINFSDIALNLIDTAGIRDSKDYVESVGIKRSFELFEKSFFKILLINPLDKNPDIPKFDRVDVIVLTHADQTNFLSSLGSLKSLPEFDNLLILNAFRPGPMGPLKQQLDGPIGPWIKKLGPIGPDLKGGPIGPKIYYQKDLPGPIGPNETNISIDCDKLVMDLFTQKYQKFAEFKPILVERHARVISKIHDKSQYFQELIKNEKDLAIIDSAFSQISGPLEELIGVVSTESLLTSIFENFCIGK